MPDEVRPDRAALCPSCNQSNWGHDEIGQPCEVFLLAAMQQIRFVSHACSTPGCLGKLEVDGLSVGLLRKSKSIAFAHEMLWDWSVRGATAGVTWHGHWRDTLARYPNSEQQKSWWLFRHRDIYEQATLDFVQLQRRHYEALFSCDCSTGGYTADGISLGYRMSQMFLVSPEHPQYHAPAGDEAGELVNGSTFDERVFIRDAPLRRSMLQFSTVGLPHTELERLKTRLQVPPPPFLHFCSLFCILC